MFKMKHLKLALEEASDDLDTGEDILIDEPDLLQEFEEAKALESYAVAVEGFEDKIYFEGVSKPLVKKMPSHFQKHFTLNTVLTDAPSSHGISVAMEAADQEKKSVIARIMDWMRNLFKRFKDWLTGLFGKGGNAEKVHEKIKDEDKKQSTFVKKKADFVTDVAEDTGAASRDIAAAAGIKDQEVLKSIEEALQKVKDKTTSFITSVQANKSTDSIAGGDMDVSILFNPHSSTETSKQLKLFGRSLSAVLTARKVDQYTAAYEELVRVYGSLNEFHSKTSDELGQEEGSRIDITTIGYGKVAENILKAHKAAANEKNAEYAFKELVGAIDSIIEINAETSTSMVMEMRPNGVDHATAKKNASEIVRMCTVVTAIGRSAMRLWGKRAQVVVGIDKLFNALKNHQAFLTNEITTLVKTMPEEHQAGVISAMQKHGYLETETV